MERAGSPKSAGFCQLFGHRPPTKRLKVVLTASCTVIKTAAKGEWRKPAETDTGAKQAGRRAVSDRGDTAVAESAEMGVTEVGGTADLSVDGPVGGTGRV